MFLLVIAAFCKLFTINLVICLTWTGIMFQLLTSFPPFRDFSGNYSHFSLPHHDDAFEFEQTVLKIATLYLCVNEKKN